MKILFILSMLIAATATTEAQQDPQVGVMLEIRVTMNEAESESTRMWTRPSHVAIYLLNHHPVQLNVTPIVVAERSANAKLAVYVATGPNRDELLTGNFRLTLNQENRFTMWDPAGNTYEIFIKPYLAPSPQVCSACSTKPTPQLLTDPDKPQ